MQGHLALVAVQLCFGLFPLLGKWAFASFEPSAVAAWRLCAGSAAFAAIAVLRYGRNVVPAPSDLPRLAVCGWLGIALNQALYLEGLQRSTALHAGLLILLIPVFTTAIAVALRQEKFEARRAAGIALAFAGAVVLVARGATDSLSLEPGVGNLLLVANALAYSFYLVLSRPLLQRYSALVVILWAYVLSLPILPWLMWDAEWAPDSAEPRHWLSLGLILLFPTVLGYLLNLYALARVTASTTAVYVFAQPLIAGLAGVLLLGERFDGNTAVASGAILGGLALVIRRRRGN